MKKILLRVWIDVKNGENIDLYLTVFVSFGLVLLGILGLSVGDLIAPITLTVLGLLAISLLQLRLLVLKSIEKQNQSKNELFLDEFPNSILSEIESAREIWLLGVNMRLFHSHYFQFEKAIRNGCSIKLLLTNPTGEGVNMAAKRSYVSTLVASRERLVENIKRTLEDFCQLSKSASSDIGIRTLDFPMGHRLIAIDPDSASGKLYIANYPYRTPGGSKPKFVLQAEDGDWYDFYKEEFNLLWNDSIIWDCGVEKNND